MSVRRPTDAEIEAIVDAIDHLTRDGGLTTIPEVERRLGLTKNGSQHSVRWLRDAGLIRTYRGRDGGVELA